MRRSIVVAMLALVLVPLSAWAQSATQAPTSFEVVSIRPVPPDTMGPISEPMGTEFRAHAILLSNLVQMTFGINPNQMVIPDWARSVKFDIEAKTGSAVPLTYDQMKPLMQKMMADRFGMTYHRETRDLQGYDMVPAKSGLKLTPAQAGASRGGSGAPGMISMPSTTMKSFAALLAARLKRPVADKTGAEGDYEVKLRFAPESDPESSLPSIFTALQEEIGIKLQPAKVPVDMIVIDRLNKTPTEN